MIINNNNIDNWLKHSAARGAAPFENADWIAMKQLLEKKRKRRLLTIWLMAGITTLVIILLLIKTNSTPRKTFKGNTNNNLTKNISGSKIEVGENAVTNIQNTIAPIDSANGLGTDNTKTLKKSLSSTLVTHQANRKNTSKTNSIATSKAGLTSIGSSSKKNKEDNVSASNQQTIKTSQRQKNNENNDASKMPDLLFAGNSAKKEMSTIIYMHNRYIGSFANTTTTTDSIVIKDTTQKSAKKTDTSQPSNSKKANKFKNYLELGVGYGVMNIGSELQTALIKINYSLTITKNLYVDMGVKGFLFNNNQTQLHKNIYRIAPILGTTNTEVDFKETSYNITKGLGVEPSIGLHYQLKRIDIGGAINYGTILNKPNRVKSFTDSFNFYNPLPLDIKLGGGNYDNDNFMGKRYTTLSFNCTYTLNRKWKLQTSYAYLIWYNKVEGVLDETKKGNSLYFTLGYKF